MKRVLVEPNRYFDSVFLMRISQELEGLPGVSQAIVAMATPANLDNLRNAGFSIDVTTSPQDLLVAIDAETDEASDATRERLEALLAGTADDAKTATSRPASMREAAEIDPDANLALISVPGDYAAREARQALRQGLHVMLFSDNVSAEDEIALKDEAIERGLLMMGPDCGTAILNGKPLGFANACRAGTVGIVGASGTGIQEISSLVHRLGGGISQAIGTGGRDLSSEVGGRMTIFGIGALADDPDTEVIVVVSKAPAPCVIPTLLERLQAADKPAVVQFVGFDPNKADPAWLETSVQFAATLEEAALMACQASGLEVAASVAAKAVAQLAPIARQVAGYFCGGTLCQEAWSLMHQAGLDVVSNVAFDPEKNAHPEVQVTGHALWDLGDDVFTVGRPHPMIEPSLRDERVANAGSDPEVGIILVDCVIGYGAHVDPARSLGEASHYAFAEAKAGNRVLHVIASVTGTDLDPQNASKQRKTLEEAGVVVAESNAAAVRMAIELLEGASP